MVEDHAQGFVKPKQPPPLPHGPRHDRDDGGLSKGAKAAAFEAGAAPITLIDGAKLIDLLNENKIGAKRAPFGW